ncbi:MAG TPA: TonB-dependent receptor [Thermoanaerobaculia bacterium]|nr:TonB-dependent receptor [Thermoanaerobaculia bacterium]
MKRVLVAAVALALLCLPAMADGPETGIIEGVVKDAGGNPLPGVVVTLTGPRGESNAVTDGNGFYRFTLVVPGSYKVRAEMDGFQPASANVNATAGGRATADLSLRLGTSEEITVTSEAPMVDKFNVTAGATVSAEVGEQTAGSTRTYYGVINTLPGVTNDSENADIQQSRPTVNGNHWADQQVFIDGVDTSFARFGGSRVFLPTTAVTEVTMEAGGSGAEYGRKIGSTTNVIVKSGTNRYHFDAALNLQDVSWDSDYDSHIELEQRENFPKPADFLKRSPIEEDNDSTGFEASLGGPIRRDKAWFFLGWSDFNTNTLDKTLNLDPVDVSLNTEARIAKLNFQPGASHQLAASYIETPASRVYFNPESNDYWTPTPHVVDGELGSLSWNWSINSNWFLETKAAVQTSDENKFLACGTTDEATCIAEKQQDRGPSGEGPLRFPGRNDHPFLPPSVLGEDYPGENYRVYLDTNNDGAWSNGWILDNGYGLNEFPRDQANAALTQFAGANHEIKYGLDWQEVQWLSDVRRPGLYSGPDFDALNPWGYEGAGRDIDFQSCGIFRLDPSRVFALNNGLITPQLNAQVLAFLFGSAADVSSPCLFRDYNAAFLQPLRGSGDSVNEDLAIYIRDRFTVGDHWTFNIGLRYEDAKGRNDVDRTVFEDQHVSPRFSTSYDLKGDGRQLISFNAGRYFAQLNQQWTNEHLQDNWGGYEEFDDFLFCDQIDVLFGLCSSVGYNFFLRRIVPGAMWDFVDAGVWNSDIRPYYKDEAILGYEWQFSANWALDVKAIWWELGDMVGATTQLGPDGQQFKFVANYEDFPEILGLIRDARVANGIPAAIDQATLDNFEEGRKEYEALQIQLNRRFGNGFAWYNNVTFSELKTTGAGAWWNNTNSDYGGDLHVVLTQGMLDQCNANQRDRNIPVDCNVLQPFIGQPVSTINRFQEERVNKPIIFNSFGYKVWQLGKQDFTLGGHLTYQSGEPWARTEGVSTFVLNGNNARNTGVGLNVEQVGDRRLDDWYQFNLQGAWGFPMGGNLRGNVRLEVLNVLDDQELLHVTSRGDPRPVRRDFQAPRSVRFLFAISI